MKSRLCLVFALSCVMLAGCYSSSNSEQDAADDPAVDPRPDGAGDTTPDTSPPPDVYPDFPPDFPPDAMACNEDSHCGYSEFCEFYAGQCRGPGICVRREDAPCPPVYDPVCGCNGITYPDICSRRLAGVSEMHPGECPEKPCLPGDPEEVCPNYFFCEGPFGACYDPGVTGWCEAIPMECPDLLDPVCGCDGITYANDCQRMQAEVWALRSGDCLEEPCLRGDPTGVCGRDAFCEGPEGMCDVIGGAGWCREPDDSCGWLWDPVCGCDHETYPNDCERQKEGVWLDRWGECDDDPPPPIRTCGPRFPDCPYGEFCEYPPGDCGRTDDSVGGCMERPATCPSIYDPVCGCDRETYGNDCTRQAAGAALCHRGECTAGSCPPG